MITKIIDLLLDNITSEYFLYSIPIIIILTTVQSFQTYRLHKYKSDTFIHSIEPLKYMLQTLLDIFILLMISSIGFIGYEVWKKDKRINFSSTDLNLTTQTVLIPIIETKNNYKEAKERDKKSSIEIVAIQESTEDKKRELEIKEKLRQDMENAIHSVDD